MPTPRLRARLDAQHDVGATQRGHPDHIAEGGLPELDRDGDGEVEAVAPEVLVGSDVDLDKEVAGRAPVEAWAAAVLEADHLPVADPGRDPRLHLAGPLLDAAALTRRAGVLDDRAATAAAAARRREREEALVVVDDSAAAALRAQLWRRTRARPAAVARLALRIRGEVQGGRQPKDRVGEVERKVGADVVATARTDPARRPAGAAPGTPEEVTEQVAEAAALHVVDVEAEPAASTRRGTAHRSEAADLVVLLALGVVAEHVVGRRHLLEAFLGGGVVRIAIGMQITGELAVGLGDLLGRGRVGHAEDAVVILLEPFALCCHLSAPPAHLVQSRVRTIAGRSVCPFHR